MRMRVTLSNAPCVRLTAGFEGHRTRFVILTFIRNATASAVPRTRIAGTDRKRPEYEVMRAAPIVTAILMVSVLTSWGPAARAADPSFSLSLKDHHFTPAEVTIPANTRVRFVVRNLDATAAEFESDDFKAEKVIPPGKEATILIPPLKPGTYEFHDEYHEAESKSRIIAK
jgi:plastocyanin